jgi:lysozyme family protein/peptidoglycan hydrolase-like protein with peptidoglycan-binding domain
MLIMARVKFSDIKATYSTLWSTVTVIDIPSTDKVVSKIMQNKAIYEEAQKGSGIWWPVIAAIHNLESSLSFKGHLHNGDPLTSRTRNVPAGRPIDGNPPFTWAQSASDALAIKHTDEVDFLDTPEEILWYCERFNGWGYQLGAGQRTTPAKRSPYLWSKTNHWQKGKYVADGSFDPNANSEQVGVAAILKRLESLGHIKFGTVESAQPDQPDVVARPTPNRPEPALQKGDKDIWVTMVQHLLNGCGYGPIAVTGAFGSDTESIVEKFNRNLGLKTPGGIVDEETWSALNNHAKLPDWNPVKALEQGFSSFGAGPSLKIGDKNAWVSVLQHTLNGCGYVIDVDGEFGSNTERVLKKFQQDVGFSETGVANTQTWNALNDHRKLPNWSPRIVTRTIISTGGFNRILFVEFAERELGRDLYWARPNDNREIRKFTKPFEPVFGRGRFAWCAATVLWCLNNFDGQGGLKIPIQIPGDDYTLALVEQWQTWMKDLGLYIDNTGVNRPQPGDLLMFDWEQKRFDEPDSDWEDHIGIFLRMSGSKFVVAEGNAQTRATGGGRTGIFERSPIVIQGWARLPENSNYDPITKRLR